MVQLRTVLEMKAVQPSRVDASTAHDKSVSARTGLINACFMVNDSDAGTYLPSDQIDIQKEYLAEASKYVLIGGETCEVPTTTRRDNCTNTRRQVSTKFCSHCTTLFRHWRPIRLTAFAPPMKPSGKRAAAGTD
jgi:hypothetical protein